MQGFEWAENNLDIGSPHELQALGVNIFFAPHISPGIKVVDLTDGRIDIFAPDADRPRSGYFADFDGLERYCRRQAVPFTEIEGYVTTLPWGTREAGDTVHRPHF